MPVSLLSPLGMVADCQFN